MSEYFKYFPTVQHDLTNDGQKIKLTNVLRRFIVRSDLNDRVDVFYEYTIQEGDRPDTLADKYYDDSDLAWLILHFNNITDPYFEWPLFGQDFTDYIKSKYGNVPQAQQDIHEYRQILNKESIKFDGTKIPKRHVVVDQTTYNSLVESEREIITKYDYEVYRNDQNRQIKILDRRYINKVRSELKTVLKNGIV
jgi:hypothetical protein